MGITARRPGCDAGRSIRIIGEVRLTEGWVSAHSGWHGVLRSWQKADQVEMGLNPRPTVPLYYSHAK